MIPNSRIHSAARSAFPTLLTGIRVGEHVLPNRIMMGSMHTRLEHMDEPIRREAAFYGARAAGGVALIVTGGFSPNTEGLLELGAPILNTSSQADYLKRITDEVHRHETKILLQILHSGRYAKHDDIVGVSDLRSPINPRTPRALTVSDIERTLDDFVRCAELAHVAGFDGVELMGSEGYLLNQFTAPRTNNRTDAWGGSLESRCRFPVELIRRVRCALGRRFIIMYRLSAADLVEGGATGVETDALALAIEAAGANIINTGYGWHEAPVPTIAYQVPRGAWSFGAARLKKVVSIPVIASNRINTPDVAESILALGHADMVSMARPLLADPDFVSKVAQGREDEINTCIACNQSCLDNIFTNKVATCLVNPRACREVEFELPARSPHRVAIAGSGPAGLAAAMEFARRGHRVTLFEADAQLGGQLNLARRIPGKGEFNELLRYLVGQLRRMAVDIRLSTRVGAAELGTDRFDYVVVATGVVPRRPRVLGIDHPKVVGYIDVIRGHVELGKRVAIIGAGGIGHDVAEFLCGGRNPQSIDEFFREWGVDTTVSTGGSRPVDEPVANRKIYILQRGLGRVGERLGKSTGWILRTRLKHHKVQSIAGVSYRRIDDSGLHITVSGEDRVLEVDSVVICAGQDSDGRLSMELNNARIPHEAIGGALRSAGLDAARAIEEATRLAQRF